HQRAVDGIQEQVRVRSWETPLHAGRYAEKHADQLVHGISPDIGALVPRMTEGGERSQRTVRGERVALAELENAIAIATTLEFEFHWPASDRVGEGREQGD